MPVILPEKGTLELLAPAKNADIGIAAIDCGADAVYIAGPSFGAREAAGNSFEDIERLTGYAKKFNVKVYLTLNTILYDHELEDARLYIYRAYEAGCSAIIIQDLGILKMELPPIPLHASTQCDIRTPAQARFLESLGFERLILARELSLEQIREISRTVNCELESFVHGALCVSYSGQCYLSQYLTGRSANRGSCIQACRSRYDLVDGEGHVLRKDKPLLSLKDLSLKEHLQQMAEAGICSFKIEGRLKNISYVRNVVRAYRNALDEVIAASSGRFAKSSSGMVYGGFVPDTDTTFNRGYTDYFLQGRRKNLLSGDFAKSVGEYIGTVGAIPTKGKGGTTFKVVPASGKVKVSNGDGLCIVTPDGTVTGLRADVVTGMTVFCRESKTVKPGAKVFRNYNRIFEKELENNLPERLLRAGISIADNPEGSQGQYLLKATDEDGNNVSIPFEAEEARNRDTAERSLREGLSKKGGIFRFEPEELSCNVLPFLPVSRLNALRREAAEKMEVLRTAKSLKTGTAVPFDRLDQSSIIPPERKVRLNCSNHLSRSLYESIGIEADSAYELEAAADMELMRCKYCLRHELGLCPKIKKGEKASPLYLINNAKRLKVSFDCARCEMVISLP